MLDERYDHVNEQQWKQIAGNWLEEISLGDLGQPSEYSDRITFMKFFARPTHLWNFIKLTTALSNSDLQRARIAISLLERLLGKNGGKFIDRIEDFAVESKEFSVLVTAVARYMIADDVWERVRRLQAAAPREIEEFNHRGVVIELERRCKLKLEELLRQRSKEAD